jgi:hypothetical protein
VHGHLRRALFIQTEGDPGTLGRHVLYRTSVRFTLGVRIVVGRLPGESPVTSESIRRSVMRIAPLTIGARANDETLDGRLIESAEAL